MRTLSWKHTLGLVTMDVELADRTLSVAVTPVQAVVLLYFQDQGELPSRAPSPSRGHAPPPEEGGWARAAPRPQALPVLPSWAREAEGHSRARLPTPRHLSTASWGLEELSEAVKMPAALLRRRLSVWLQQGVLREEPAGTFSVVEEERPQDRDSMVLVDSDDESDSGLASQADQKEEELLVCPARPGDRGAGRGGAARPNGGCSPSSSGRTSRPC